MKTRLTCYCQAHSLMLSLEAVAPSFLFVRKRICLPPVLLEKLSNALPGSSSSFDSKTHLLHGEEETGMHSRCKEFQG